MNKYVSILFSFLLLACQSVPMSSSSHNQNQFEDKYLWLEEVEGDKALQFARSENERTIEHFKKNPLFKTIEHDVRKIILAKDRMPALSIRDGELYNFWQDENHVRGLWRKTTVASYKTGKPQWDIIIDVDKLAKEENENWVWRGPDFRSGDMERTFIHLSRGGKDASVIREFDMKTRKFVTDGFTLPESKGSVTWIDRDTVYVARDFGADTLTDSGYPRIMKKWKRGTPLSSAVKVMEVAKDDMSIYAWHFSDEGYDILSRKINFYEEEIFYVNPQGEQIRAPFPISVEFKSAKGRYAFFQLKEDLGKFVTGSILALKVDDFADPKAMDKVELVFVPTEKRFAEWVMTTKHHILISVIDDIVSKVLRVERDAKGQWQLSEISLGNAGMTGISAIDEESDKYIVNYTDFLTPTSMYLGDASDKKNHMTLLDESPKRFDATGMHVERHLAKSKDGTMIPYFLVSKKAIKKDGTNPTLQYGYGGFEYALQPNYLGTIGKTWLERGGVYVLSNLRGGGEFGPKWHRAVLKENRYKVYEDNIAISEDLIKSNITSPKHLGIQGGSNGGLLVGATAMLRPDLYNAVLCQVPLLDMLRYHKLLAGASWMAEYGDPDDEKMRESILKYSPYQKVEASAKYPEIFFMTSTKDDRVHPGHARKMYAKMKELGHQAYYYENMEGGHGGNANLEQTILWKSLELTYLWEKLGPAK